MLLGFREASCSGHNDVAMLGTDLANCGSVKGAKTGWAGTLDRRDELIGVQFKRIAEQVGDPNNAVKTTAIPIDQKLPSLLNLGLYFPQSVYRGGSGKDSCRRTALSATFPFENPAA